MLIKIFPLQLEFLYCSQKTQKEASEVSNEIPQASTGIFSNKRWNDELFMIVA